MADPSGAMGGRRPAHQVGLGVDSKLVEIQCCGKSRSTRVLSRNFELGGVLPFSHRYIVEDEEFLLAVSTDEPTSINPLELGGERIFRLLATVRACQHRALSYRQYPCRRKTAVRFRRRAVNATERLWRFALDQAANRYFLFHVDLPKRLKGHGNG